MIQIGKCEGCGEVNYLSYVYGDPHGAWLCNACKDQLEGEGSIKLRYGEVIHRTIIVVVSKIREDNTGTIEAYRVSERALDEQLKIVCPTSNEDWLEILDWLEENGTLVQTITPNYTITVEV